MRTRLIRLFPVLLAVLLFGAAEAYAQTATVVTHSGQRLRGQILSLGSGYDNYGNFGGFDGNNDYDAAVVLRVNGRDRQIPVQDVAFVDFAGNGTVSQSELNRARQSYEGLVVLRNGRTMAGRVVDLQGRNNQAVISGPSGDRNIALNQVARPSVS